MQMLAKENESKGEHSAWATTADSVLSEIVTKYVDKKWIVNTGATNHMTSRCDLLDNFTTIPKSERRQILLPTGNVVPVSHVGCSKVLGDQVIGTVLFVLEFKCNLLSFSQLTKDLHCMATFFPDLCVFQNLSSGQVKGIDREDQGFYIVKEDSSNSGPISTTSSFHSDADSISLWHKRLGHASIDAIKKSSSINVPETVEHPSCTICPLVKQTKFQFPINSHTSNAVFELIHCDIWGYRIPTHDGMKYFVTIVDDFSRYSWFFLVPSKSETIVILRHFLTQVQNLLFTNVKTLRTDNGSEFLVVPVNLYYLL